MAPKGTRYQETGLYSHLTKVGKPLTNLREKCERGSNTSTPMTALLAAASTSVIADEEMNERYESDEKFLKFWASVVMWA
jgi:hypothetical protein